MSRSGIIAFTAFVVFLTLLSIVYEYNLNFEETFKYVLIGVAIITLISVGITVCYICSVQIHAMLDNKHAEAHHLTSDSTSSMNFRSNIAVIQMMDRLSLFSDCAVKTLPTYNKAIMSSFPVPTLSEQVPSPPPPYTAIIIPSALLQECPPPPNYDDSTDIEDEIPMYSADLPSPLPIPCCTPPQS